MCWLDLRLKLLTPVDFDNEHIGKYQLVIELYLEQNFLFTKLKEFFLVFHQN